MDGFSQGMDALVVPVVPAARFPALGSMAFGVRDLAAPKDLPRRAEVPMLLTSLVVPVLFAFAPLSWFGSHAGANVMLAPYYFGAVVPPGSLALALYARPRVGKGARSRTALVLAVVLSSLVYAAPALLCGYAFRGAFSSRRLSGRRVLCGRTSGGGPRSRRRSAPAPGRRGTWPGTPWRRRSAWIGRGAFWRGCG